MGAYPHDHYSFPVITPPHVSTLRKIFNFLGCIAAFPFYWFIVAQLPYVITLDTILSILLAELNRFANERRRIKFYEQETCVRDKADPEKGEKSEKNEKFGLRTFTTPRFPSTSFLTSSPPRLPTTFRLQIMAAVVGWREDPSLFTRALESYKYASGCRFLLVGIDGDDAQDEEMMNVFNHVYPDNSMVLHLTEPLCEIAESVRGKVVAQQADSGHPVNEVECDMIALQHCIQLVKTILEQHKISFTGSDSIRQLCIRQPHMHKKGIMFSSFIFSLVIADILGIEFLWSSDSDTLVMPDSLERTVSAMAVDPTIGGASSGLTIHNHNETIVAELASTVYWGELYLTKSTPAATTTNDCQSGPCSVFRLAALPPILIPWYRQAIFGKRMIINEDRHLTTQLLSRGWRVVFASDVLAATDTPTTMARWLKQQVRWSRSTHAESLLQPKAYLMNHPFLFWCMAKREIGTVVCFVGIVYYFITSQKLIHIAVYDIALRIPIAIVYNFLRNPHRLSWQSLRWVLPGVFFFYIPLPALHCWALCTMTADGWGTTMRSSSELVKKDSTLTAWWETGFFVVWMGVVSGSIARVVSGYLALDSMHETVAVLLSTLIAAFWAWKVTIYKIS
ncbi:hypothetical protein B0I35DRAFT_432226 [Stachybotrys elegans]|uniref:Glycosyltransferase 2-like domain-containing protein n=1 Tax=Stachybotrys elegans TaxID=80388 RepID=A0A8K0WSH1_9HYPO|nr:hypothetical protein B0I35DRAFT_432226 [Stachybotrys elegans]